MSEDAILKFRNYSYSVYTILNFPKYFDGFFDTTLVYRKYADFLACLKLARALISKFVVFDVRVKKYHLQTTATSIKHFLGNVLDIHEPNTPIVLRVKLEHDEENPQLYFRYLDVFIKTVHNSQIGFCLDTRYRQLVKRQYYFNIFIEKYKPYIKLLYLNPPYPFSSWEASGNAATPQQFLTTFPCILEYPSLSLQHSDANFIFS